MFEGIFIKWFLIFFEEKPRSVPVFNDKFFNYFSRIQFVSRLPPLRYRFGLSDPPKAVAPRSVRCAVSNPASKIVKLAVARAENSNTTIGFVCTCPKFF